MKAFLGGAMVRPLAFLVLVGSALPGFAAPLWVTTYGSDTPFDTEAYLTGFGIAPQEGKGLEGLQAAEDQALKNLGQKLKVNVEASSRLTDSEFGEKNFSSYQSDVKAMVSLNLGGVDHYESFFDPGQNRWLALAALNKVKMQTSLGTERTQLVAQLGSDLADLHDLLPKKRPDLLAESLQTFDRHLDALVQNVALARLVGDPMDPQAALQKFYDEKTGVERSIRAQKLVTPRDLVVALTHEVPWPPTGTRTVVLIPAVYKTTDISGQFFSYIRDELENSLRLTYPGLKVLSPSPDLRPDLVFKGSFFEAGQGWHVVFKLSDLRTNALVATWETDLDADFVRAQPFELVPANIQVATADHDRQVAVYDHPVKTELRVWTNKGSEGLVFKKGEKVSFYVEVNRPGRLSILYHLAGSRRWRVPLVENYPILASQIGTPIKIEQEFEVTPPYGSESAQVFFSPDPIPAFPTVKATVDGEEFDVLSEDYDQFLVKTRGLKTAKATSDAEDLKTDVSLTLTTVPGP